MNVKQLGMIFGSQYYRFPFPESHCWERDMNNMRELGFNTVKLWAVWNEIEPVRGEYHFEALDELMSLAWKNGLHVVINTIPEGAPSWLYEGNEDALYQTASGETVTSGGPANLPSAGWPGLCMDKPAAAQAVQGFIRAVAAHVANHPAMLTIDVWNEPHLEPMFDYRNNMLCYCEHSIAQFRQWLRNKYQSIENLNKAWFRKYSDWEQALPPPRLGTWADMMDWRLFWLDNMRRWMRLRVQAAKDGAPNLPVQSHVAYSGYVGTSGAGGLANELGDEFSLSRETDVFGLTCFPKWLMRNDPWFNHLINNEIVAAASFDRPFYQVELQGGGGKAGLLGGEVPTAADIRYWNYATVAAGGKGVTYWQYAPEPAGIESPGFGLTGLLGQNTPRSLEASRCAVEMNVPALAQAKRVPAANAIYLSRTNSVWFYGAGREEQLYAQAIHGAYAIAYQNGIPVTFAHQDRVETLYEDGVRTLILPMPLVLSAKETKALKRFVYLGGTLVSEAFAGLYDQGGKLDENTTALHELFGLKHIEVDRLPNSDVPCPYRQLVEAEEGTEIMARFEDGYPSLVQRSIGAGKAVWLGGFPLIRSAETYDTQLAECLLGYMQLSGYSQWKRLQVTAGQSALPRRAPIVRLLENDTQWIVVLLNPMEDAAKITITPGTVWEGRTELVFHLAAGECKWLAFQK